MYWPGIGKPKSQIQIVAKFLFGAGCRPAGFFNIILDVVHKNESAMCGFPEESSKWMSPRSFFSRFFEEHG